MIVAAVIAAAALVGFGAFGPAIGRRLPPVAATAILVVGSLVVVGSSCVLLGVIGLSWLSGLLWGRFTPRVAVRPEFVDPVPTVLGVACLLLLGLVLAGGLATAGRLIRGLVALLRGIPAAGVPDGPVAAPLDAPTDLGGDHPLVVLDDDVPDAFTIPRPAGRIFVTTGLLAALSTPEQRVVLVHEEAHLRYHHGWLRFAADLASGFLPVLRPAAAGVRDALERWADEYVARRVGNRTLVARAVAHAALLRSAAPAASVASFASRATDGDVTRRVRSLLEPAPRRGRWLAGTLVALLAVGGLSTVVAASTGGVQVDAALDATRVVVSTPAQLGPFRVTPAKIGPLRVAPSRTGSIGLLRDR